MESDQGQVGAAIRREVRSKETCHTKGKTSVASWEQGKSMPDAVTLYQLARFFGKDLEDFYKIE